MPGKRKREEEETPDDKKERKRAKKEAKKTAKKEKKEAKKKEKELKKAKKEAKKAEKEAKKKLKKESKHKESKQLKIEDLPETETEAVKTLELASSSVSAPKPAPTPTERNVAEPSSAWPNFDSSKVIKGIQNWDVNASVFHKKKVELVVSLLPYVLGSVRNTVLASLNNFLMKYSDGIHGIALAYTNVKIIGGKNGQGMGLGFILNELPFIHYKVSCDMLTFCPKIGSKVTGAVTQCFPSHVGLLVLTYFNAMIPAEQLHSIGYTYDFYSKQWHHQEDKSKTIQEDDNIHFVISNIHNCAGVLSMEGIYPSVGNGHSSTIWGSNSKTDVAKNVL